MFTAAPARSVLAAASGRRRPGRSTPTEAISHGGGSGSQAPPELHPAKTHHSRPESVVTRSIRWPNRESDLNGAGCLRSERPDFYEHEHSSAGPSGTVLAYSTDTFHRGTEITAPRSARYSAHVSYRHADNSWTGRHAWGDRSFHPGWNPFAEQATMRQLLLFGFPPPRHPYWTPQTLKDLTVRYPGLDTRQWRTEHQQATTSDPDITA